MTYEYQVVAFPSFDAEHVLRHDTACLTSLTDEVNALLAEGWEILQTRIETGHTAHSEVLQCVAWMYYYCRRPRFPGDAA